jgi:CPA1 family monovalent cation:H+ antiporter
MPFRADIVTVSFAVVAFSVFVQGLTMTPFLRALGEIPSAPSGEARSAERAAR